MSVLYLVFLLGALGCMALLDRRYRLFFWRRARRAAAVTSVALAFFIAWDLSGIGLGIFVRGHSPLETGLLVAPEFPVEELFFLAFLVYLTAVLITGSRRILATR